MKKEKKWANKSRGLMLYAQGKDLYGKEFYVQDGSWAMLNGCRIYFHNSDNEGTPQCLSLTTAGATKLVKGLNRFIKLKS